MLKEPSPDAPTPSARIDQEPGDIDRRWSSREICDQLHDRSRCLSVQSDMTDDSFVVDSDPRCERLGPDEKPLEVPVGEEDRVLVRLADASGKGAEFVQVIVASLPEFHGSQSVEGQPSSSDHGRFTGGGPTENR